MRVAHLRRGTPIETTATSQKTQDREQGLDLHACMIAGEVDALARIFDLYFVRIVNKVKSKFPRYFDPHQYESSVNEALVDYLRNPSAYNPARGISLFSYLVMAARGDFQNLVEKDRRLLRDQNPLVVEDDDDAPELDLQDPRYENFEEVLMRNESIVWENIAEVLPDPRDQRCVYAMMEQERATSAFAGIYGLTSLPPKEQEHEVKKHKDRVKKRLLRKLDPEEYRRHD
jgi:RNA polymerase sigma-70 factor (ECF subfamily)